ncbi:serine hydrolase domain-containing protein [Ferrimicrobium sp.]|uniref:serine hydrolase domain-containing protein n=1 Tax=Ferrimicrobium sp. TaxID=2926050 RepID=UPI00260B4618|nr:serine hydrolase domain-containing protein [Ferrimicrobium sp.]
MGPAGAGVLGLLDPGDEVAYGQIGSGGLTTRYQSNGAVSRPWASVTKLVTALAILVAIEEGALARTSPLGEHQLLVEDLLSHSSGLPTGEVGELSMIEPWQARPVCTPHERRIYSNIGYELLGYGLVNQSGMPLHQYVGEAVLEPAGMKSASYLPTVLTEQHVTGAAFGLEGTINDLIALVEVLFFPLIVAPETLSDIRTPFVPDLAGILPGFGRQDPNPWGLGAELRGTKSPHWMGSAVSEESYGHFGQSGSFLWIDPIQRAFAVFLGPRPFGAWARDRWPVLNNAIIEELASS